MMTFKGFFAAVAVATLGFTAAPAMAWDWNDYGHDPDASASTVAGAGALCSGYCATDAVTTGDTGTYVDSDPFALSWFDATGETNNSGFDFGFLAQESGVSLLGNAEADASLVDADASAALQGDASSLGFGDIVWGDQQVTGEIDGFAFDAPGFNQTSGADGSGSSLASMLAASIGGPAVSAFVQTAVSVSLQTN